MDALLDLIQKYLNKNIKLQLIDEYGMNGDFVESPRHLLSSLYEICIKNFLFRFQLQLNCNKNQAIGGEIIEN